MPGQITRSPLLPEHGIATAMLGAQGLVYRDYRSNLSTAVSRCALDK